MARNKEIDNLRGLAMLAMIIIHATAYFLSNKAVYYLWDILEWAVPIFMFCSLYIFYKRPKKIDLKKRFSRLLIPYYIFLGAYFVLIYFFEKQKFNLGNISANVFLYGGLDFNWLVLLFLYLTLLMPLIFWLEKKKVWFYGFFSLSLISSIYFIFHNFNYRLVMWLPWSLFIFFTIFFVKNENNKKIMSLTAFSSLALFFGLRLMEARMGHDLSQYANKYPPTLYHISFGIFSIIVIYYLSKMKVFSFLWIDKLLDFLSFNSYSLFFIHILVIFSLTWMKFHFANWFTFFLAIFGLSSGIQILLNSVIEVRNKVWMRVMKIEQRS